MIVLVKSSVVLFGIISVTALIYYFFLQGIQHKITIIPRICLSSKQNSSILCYTCLNRNYSTHFNLGPLLLSATHNRMNLIEFAKISNYSCDQLFQLVDLESYISEGIFKIELLEHVYQNMRLIKGKVYSKASNQKIINRETQQVLIVQLLPQQQGSDVQPLKVASYSSQAYDRLIRIGYCLFIVSITITILIELYKQYKQLVIEKSVIFDVMTSLVFLTTLIIYPEILQLDNYRMVQMVFYLSIIILNPYFRYLGVVCIFLVFVQKYQYKIYGQVLFLIIYCSSILGNKYFRKQPRFVCICVLLNLYIADKWYLYFFSSPIKKMQYIIILWMIFLFTPTLNNLLRTIGSPTQQKYFELRQEELYHYSEQHLKVDEQLVVLKNYD